MRHKEEDYGHPSEATDAEDRFPRDRKLRAAGYKVHARLPHGPALWASPDGRILTFAQALREIEKVEAEIERATT